LKLLTCGKNSTLYENSKQNRSRCWFFRVVEFFKKALCRGGPMCPPAYATKKTNKKKQQKLTHPKPGAKKLLIKQTKPPNKDNHRKLRTANRTVPDA